MAKFSPRTNKRKKKSRSRGRRGIGANGENVYDVCVPVWAAIVLGGLASYGIIKAVK